MIKFKEPYYKLLLLSVLTGFLIPLICFILPSAFSDLQNYVLVSRMLNTISSICVAAADMLIVIAALQYNFLKCLPFVLTVLIVQLITFSKIAMVSWSTTQQFPEVKTFIFQWIVVCYCSTIAIPILYVMVAKLFKKFIQNEIILMLVTLVSLSVVGQVFVLLQRIPMMRILSTSNNYIPVSYISSLHANIAAVLLPLVYSVVTYFIFRFVRRRADKKVLQA
jgi:hypothetical protein